MCYPAHVCTYIEGLSWLEEEQEEGPHFDELQQELEALMERVKIKALPPGVPTSSSAAAKVTRPTMCEELLEEVLMEVSVGACVCMYIGCCWTVQGACGQDELLGLTGLTMARCVCTFGEETCHQTRNCKPGNCK